jgi:hypothetical protein
MTHLIAGFPPRRLLFNSGSSHVGLVVNKFALVRICSEYFRFLCHFSFHIYIKSGAGRVAEVASGLSFTSNKIGEGGLMKSAIK